PGPSFLRLVPLRPPRLREESGHALRGVEAHVVAELHLGRVAHAQAAPQLAAEEARRGLEPRHRPRAVGLAAQDPDVDAGQPRVRSQLHPGHGHESDARVLELARDDPRRLLADLLGQALVAARHSDSYCASRSSTLRAVPASPATLRRVDSRCTPSVFTDTTARRARSQRSWCSTSPIETLKRFRI